MDVEKFGPMKGVIVMPRPPSKKARTARKYNADWGQRIKAFRRTRGLSQTELAQKIGISQRALSDYEMATCRLPAEVLLKLSQSFRVSMYELTNGKISAPPPPKNGRKVRAIVEKIETLPPKKQQQVVEYVEFISRSNQHAA